MSGEAGGGYFYPDSGDEAESGGESEFRLPDGTWSCIRDGVTEPCGDCDGCRHIAAINAAQPAGGRPDAAPGLVPYQIPSFQQPARIPLGNQLPHTSRRRPGTKGGA